jgi:hypothetical protein
MDYHEKPVKIKLPKHHAGQVRTTASISFSLPAELEAPLNELAAELGFNRSQYIVHLLETELRKKGLDLRRKVPYRIRRKEGLRGT